MKRMIVNVLSVLALPTVFAACAPGLSDGRDDAGLPDPQPVALGHEVSPAAPTGGIPLSDELNSAATLSSWTAVSIENSAIDIGARAPGHLSLSFEPSTPMYSAWYQDLHGAFLHRLVSGDFRVVTAVTVSSLANPEQGPSRQYTSAGLMVRDPASAPGSENWVVMNLGFQQDSLATESKNTDDSVSVLQLRPTEGVRAAELAICRVGSTVRVFRRLLGSQSWEQDNSYERADLPSTVQVGLMANAWETPADLLAEFDYIRFDRPGDLQDCTVEGMNLL